MARWEKSEQAEHQALRAMMSHPLPQSELLAAHPPQAPGQQEARWEEPQEELGQLRRRELLAAHPPQAPGQQEARMEQAEHQLPRAMLGQLQRQEQHPQRAQPSQSWLPLRPLAGGQPGG